MNSWNQQWPYPSSLGPGMTPSPRLARMYAQASGRPLLSMGLSQPGMSGVQRAAEFDFNSPDAHGFPRSAVGMDSLHCESEQSANYSQPQPSAFTLPSAPSGAMMDYGASPWSPKVWDSLLNAGRPSNTGIYPEPEGNTSLNQTPFAYMLPSHVLPSTEVPQSTTAAMAPTPSSDTDRTLPNPTCRSQQLPTSAASLNTLSSEGDSNLTCSADFKGSFWSQQCSTSSDSRTPTHTVPSSASFSSSSPPPAKCSSASSNAPELLFNYLPMPTTTDEIAPALSSSAAPTTSTATSTNTSFASLNTVDTMPEYKTIPSDTRLSRSISREQSSTGQRHLTVTNNGAPDIYGYSSGEKKSRTSGDSDSRCSGTTLMSGLPYHRIRHTDTPNPAFSFNLFPDILPEYHRSVVENAQRPPVSPLGNQGAY